ncbi:MAG: hypothetical protein GC200_02305 [Tepidisphaera sp.]|nr:hypothetical protein [Tepidisphaera sp.]
MSQRITPQQIPQVLQAAEQAANRGNLVFAEGMMRDCLDMGLNHPGLHHMLARIALSVDAFGPAADNMRNLQRTLPTPDPEISTTIAALEQRAADQRRELSAHPRYMLIRAWGCGFCSDVDHVLGCLLLAEATGRTPIVRWGQESLFCDQGVDNAWPRFFEPVSSLTYDQLPKADLWPPKWNADTLLGPRLNWDTGEWSRVQYMKYFARPEETVVMDYMCRVPSVLPWLPASHPLKGASPAAAFRTLVAKYLRPVPEVAAAAAEFFTRHLSPGPAIAVHIRGSDKTAEDPALEAGNTALREGVIALARQRAGAKIFLLTDSTRELSAMRAALGDRVVATPSLRTGGDVGLHHMPEQNRTKLGREVMIDMYIAAMCNALIGPGNSNVSCLIDHLRDWPAGSVKFQIPNFQLSRNYFGYNW